MFESFRNFLCPFSPALGDVKYLHAQRNSSLEFSCVPPENPASPFALTLMRDWLERRVVLYHNFNTEPVVKDPSFMDRTSDRIVKQTGAINVTITRLQGSDTDVYICLFHYSTATNFQNLSGRNKYLLYIQDPRE